jgi:hypothetical protein
VQADRLHQSQESGGSHIIVDPGFAHDLHEYLRKRLVVVASPQEAISRTVRIYRADDGRIIRDEEPLDHAFDAEAAPKQLEKLVGEWLTNEPQ